MSVTFRIPEAPVVRVLHACEICEGTGRDGEDTCIYCGGVGRYLEVEPAHPFFEINVSNANARALLYVLPPVLECGDDLCGEWSGPALIIAYRGLMLAMNKQHRKESLLAPTYMDGNCTYIGRSAEYVDTRLTQLLELVKLARQHGFSITFG